MCINSFARKTTRFRDIFKNAWTNLLLLMVGQDLLDLPHSSISILIDGKSAIDILFWGVAGAGENLLTDLPRPDLWPLSDESDEAVDGGDCDLNRPAEGENPWCPSWVRTSLSNLDSAVFCRVLDNADLNEWASSIFDKNPCFFCKFFRMFCLGSPISSIPGRLCLIPSNSSTSFLNILRELGEIGTESAEIGAEFFLLHRFWSFSNKDGDLCGVLSLFPKEDRLFEASAAP